MTDKEENTLITNKQENTPITELRPERVMAFSDGVFAIAITLLILEIHIPELSCANSIEASTCTENLWVALVHQWPHYLSFLLSFAIVGTLWLNHHNTLSYFQKTDMNFNIINLFLLLDAVVLPFPAGLLGEYMGTSQQQIAISVYCGTWFAGAIIYNFVWWYASHNYRLIDPTLSKTIVRRITRLYLFGPVMSGLGFALTFIGNGLIGLGLCIVTTIFFLVPRFADRKYHLKAS